MTRKRNNSGFTLIEIAIALLVVAIGVLAVFALFGSGLDSSSRAIADTQAAMFADGVLNALRSKSVGLAQEQNQATGTLRAIAGTLRVDGKDSSCPWENFWYDFKDPAGTTYVTVAAEQVWPKAVGGQPIKIKATPPSSPVAVVFTNMTQRGPITEFKNEIVNNALRYTLVVQPKYASFFTTNNLWKNRMMVTLKIWDGQYGQIVDGDALVFYTEYANPGDL